MNHVNAREITTRIKVALTALLSVGIMFTAHAKDDDLLQEVKISAVSQKADIKNNQIIFYGPVNVSQGSIDINADELRAFTSENSVTKTLIATGNPATFSQELEDGQVGTASALEVRYDLATTTLTLTGNAKLDQAGSEVTGNLIRYNISKQELIAESTGEGDDRVITIIQPQNFQEQPEPQQPVLDSETNSVDSATDSNEAEPLPTPVKETSQQEN